MRSKLKPKQITTSSHAFSRAWRRLHVFVSTFDWFIALFKSAVIGQTNSPFPSCFEPHYESEAKYKVYVMKISFHSYANKTNFHIKSFALSFAFIVRFTATRKWPVTLVRSITRVFCLDKKQLQSQRSSKKKRRKSENRALRHGVVHGIFFHVLDVLARLPISISCNRMLLVC